MEAGAGNPWVPTGWVNAGFIAGELVQELATIHSGVSALEIVTPVANRNLGSSALGLAVNDYVAIGGWGYVVTTPTFIREANNRILEQAGGALAATPVGAAWNFVTTVGRVDDAGAQRIWVRGGAACAAFWDDFYAIALDPISLTVTPASQANSLEGTGIRVDGGDGAVQPILPGQLQTSIGHVRFYMTFRHSAAILNNFAGGSVYYADFNFDVNRRFILYSTGANQIRLLFNDGGGVHSVSWDCTGLIVAGIRYKFDIVYTPYWMRLYQGGILRVENANPVNFTAVPNVANWGHQSGGALQGDVVIG